MNTQLTPALAPGINVDGLRYARVARSEWTKLRSLRSSGYAPLAAIAMLIAFGIIDAATTVTNWATLSAKEKASFDPLLASLSGIDGAQLAGASLSHGGNASAAGTAEGPRDVPSDAAGASREATR
jgi:hypothetical protein